MSDWDFSVVGGQKRWTITFPDGVALRIYLNPGGHHRWQVVVGERVVDSDSAEDLRVAQKTACDALIAYAQKLLEAARRIGQ